MPEYNCIFCQIAAGEAAADIIHEDDDVVAFRDVKPGAPTHILVIPRRHIPSVDVLDEQDAPLVGKLFVAARDIARDQAIAEAGYRLVMNNGRLAGQSVDHIHLHVLGGRALDWPPG